MIFSLQKRVCYLVIGYLAAETLATSAAQYRGMSAIIDRGDDLGSVARDLARMSGTSPTDEQMAFLIGELARQNNINVSSNSIAAGTVLNVGSAQSWADFFQKLNVTKIVASSRVNIPGQRPIDVNYVTRGEEQPIGGCAGWNFQQLGQILINIDAINWQMDFRDEIHKRNSWFSGLYGGDDPGKHYAREVLYHEYVHLLTTPIIHSPAFKDRLTELTRGRAGDPYYIAREVSGWTSMFYVSDDPRVVLEMLRREFVSDVSGNSAHAIIKDKLKDKYGTGNMLELFKTPKKSLQEFARTFVRDTFDTELPDPKYFVVSDAAFSGKDNSSPAAIKAELESRKAFDAGRNFGQQRMWSFAARELRRAAELNPANERYWFWLATVLVYDGRVAEYEALRGDALNRFKDANGGRGSMIAAMGLLLPASGSELEIAGNLADRALVVSSSQSDSAGLDWARIDRSLADYRRSHYPDAIKYASLCLQAEGAAQAYGVLALSYARLGHRGEATFNLNLGKKQLNETLLSAGAPDLPPGWPGLLVAHTLLKEAEALIARLPQ